MANRISNAIRVEDMYLDKLKEIAEVGICEYYMPRSKDLTETMHPAKVVSKEDYLKQMELNKTAHEYDIRYVITSEMQKELIEKYGFYDWYDWGIENWGSKWGAFDNSIEGNTYHFETANATISDKILNMLLEDIPNFEIIWEDLDDYLYHKYYTCFVDGKIDKIERR